ncbi:hypothetical protein [Frankia sp. CiP3]|uniref:transmembrane-type terpene cyclase n=1 Tax=Frankia sp. CiP3 TaxID=2880971 RepID=UPI001EF55A9B|nr:hypothetical protein [Frankia sp. CiP3]
MVAYIAIIYRGFRDRAYGMPVAALGANLSWEFIYSFLLDPFTDQIHILSIPCFVIDLVIAYQCLRYGRRTADIPLVRRFFSLLVCVAIAFPVVYGGFYELNDPAGEYTGFGINFMMAMLFVAMLLRRNSSIGQSMWIAIAKWQGTLFAWIVTAMTVTTGTYHQWLRSFWSFWAGSVGSHTYPLTSLINFMYGVAFVVDLVYILLLRGKLRREGKIAWRHL